jgi:hypothetical protein
MALEEFSSYEMVADAKGKLRALATGGRPLLLNESHCEFF